MRLQLAQERLAGLDQGLRMCGVLKPRSDGLAAASVSAHVLQRIRPSCCSFELLTASKHKAGTPAPATASHWRCLAAVCRTPPPADCCTATSSGGAAKVPEFPTQRTAWRGPFKAEWGRRRPLPGSSPRRRAQGGPAGACTAASMLQLTYRRCDPARRRLHAAPGPRQSRASWVRLPPRPASSSCLRPVTASAVSNHG